MSERVPVPESPHAPLIAYDDTCPFCTRRAEWIHRIAAGKAICVPFRQAAAAAPEIPEAEFKRALVLIHPDGTVAKGAQAVFEILAAVRGWRWPLWLYHRVPGFGRLSEWCYQVIARHRAHLPTL